MSIHKIHDYKNPHKDPLLLHSIPTSDKTYTRELHKLDIDVRIIIPSTVKLNSICFYKYDETYISTLNI